MSKWIGKHIFGNLGQQPKRNLILILQKIPLIFLRTCLWRLSDATHENQGKNHTLQSQCLCHSHVNHLQEHLASYLLCLDTSWHMDGERGESVLILFGKCFLLWTNTEVLLFHKGLLSPVFHWLYHHSCKMKEWPFSCVFLFFFWFRESGRPLSMVKARDDMVDQEAHLSSSQVIWQWQRLLRNVVRLNWWPLHKQLSGPLQH